jgi:hypothetical protein
MSNRFKQALVESYIGAIGLGYLFAQCVLHFVSLFALPLTAWVSREMGAKHSFPDEPLATNFFYPT